MWFNPPTCLANKPLYRLSNSPIFFTKGSVLPLNLGQKVNNQFQDICLLCERESNPYIATYLPAGHTTFLWHLLNLRKVPVSIIFLLKPFCFTSTCFLKGVCRIVCLLTESNCQIRFTRAVLYRLTKEARCWVGKITLLLSACLISFDGGLPCGFCKSTNFRTGNGLLSHLTSVLLSTCCKDKVGFEPTHGLIRLLVFKTNLFTVWVLIHIHLVQDGVQPSSHNF